MSKHIDSQGTDMQTETSNVATRARLNPGRQWIGIRNLEFTEEIQPRAGLDRGWVNDLSKFRLEGSEFPPIRVYQTPDGRLIPGEGHHRSMALASAGEDQILCDVVDGTMEDAIVYAAASNRSNGVKPMGPKDITKAVEMLFTVDAWWKKSNSTVAEHVGCSNTKVMNIRERLISGGKQAPERIETVDGKTMPRRHSPGQVTSRTDKRGYTSYRTQVKGKEHRSANKAKIDALAAEEKQRKWKNRISLGGESAQSYLRSLAFQGVFMGKSGVYPGVRASYRAGVTCCPCDFSTNEDLRLAIANLIAARRYKGDLTARMVVLCHPEDGPAKLMDLYRAEGFEFLTPEELTESLKES